MSSGGDSFRHESLQDCASIIKYFQALGEGFLSGSLSFSVDNKRLVLKPQGLVRLEVEARRKGNQVNLGLKFRWNEEDAGAGELFEKPLHISPGEES